MLPATPPILNYQATRIQLSNYTLKGQNISFTETMAANDQLSVKARAFSVSALIGNSSVIGEHQSQTQTNDGVNVELMCRELWKQFHTLGTEMIITKAGRRMFPSLKIRLSGLDENTLYVLYVDMDPVDDRRYKYVYQSSKWVPGGQGDVPHNKRRFVHPDGPQLGGFWNTQSCIAFDKLKLTNNRKPQQQDLIPLHSMHQYQPTICVQPVNEYQHALSNDSESSTGNNFQTWRSQCSRSKAIVISFPETRFITVTAYQNQQITRLKIASNPFAKGFRESKREKRAVAEEDGMPLKQSTPRLFPTPAEIIPWTNYPIDPNRIINGFVGDIGHPFNNWWIHPYQMLPIPVSASFQTEEEVSCLLGLHYPREFPQS